LAAAAGVSPLAAAERAPARGDTSAAAHSILAHCFDTVLRLLHPVVPFITEELWQKLPGRRPGEWLAAAAWPARRPALDDAPAADRFERVRAAIERIRAIRAEYRIPPKTRLRATIVPRGGDRADIFASERETITRLAGLAELSIDGAAAGAGAHAVFGDASEVFVPLEGAIDVAHECRRLGGELERLDKQLAALAARLGSESFVARAPQDVIAREREKQRAWQSQHDVLAEKLKALGCG
jgi:valyl-tRNA synthetase